MRNWGALLVTIVGAVVLAIMATTPPRPRGADAPLSDFSAIRAMTDIRAIGHAPHPVGSPEHERVRGYLASRLASLGFAVSTMRSPISAKGARNYDKQRGSHGTPPPIIDIVATRPGRDRSLPAVMLMAHYDSVFGSPAAADDSAGVASVLETARAVQASGRPRRDLMVVITDGEEMGLDGSRAFFAHDPRARRAGVIINLETRGGGGRASMFETGDGNGAMMRLFARAVRHPDATSLSVFIYKHLPNDTDLTIAKAHGFAGFNFAFIGRPSEYHSPSAVPDALDQGALQDMGAQVLDLTRALLGVSTLPGRAPDLVFFDAFGLTLIHYPAPIGWLLLVAAAGLYIAGAWRRSSWRDFARGAGASMAVSVSAAALLYGGNLLSGADGKVNYYDRLAAIPRLEVQTLLVCLGALGLVWAWLGTRGERGAGFATGSALPLLILGVIAQAAAPTAAYPIVVSLLLGGAGLAALSWLGEWAGKAAVVIAATLVTGYITALGFLLIEAVGPVTPMVAAVPLTIATIVIAPIAPATERRPVVAAAGVLLAAAVAIALWVRLDPVAGTVAVYSTFK